MSDSDSDQMEKAIALVTKINEKVDDLLKPLELEIKIMQWAPEFQAIIWEAVMLNAQVRGKRILARSSGQS